MLYPNHDLPDHIRKESLRLQLAAREVTRTHTLPTHDDVDAAVRRLTAGRLPAGRSIARTDEAVIELAISALYLLGTGVYAPVRPSWLIRRLRLAWTDIWAWAEYLLLHGVRDDIWDDTYNGSAAFRILGSVYRVVYLLSFDDDAVVTMSRTRGVAENLAHYWYLEDDCPHIRSIGTFCEVLMRLLEERRDWTAVVCAVGGTRPFARMLMRRLKEARCDVLESSSTLYFSLKLVFFAIRRSSEGIDLRRDLLVPGLSAEVIRCVFSACAARDLPSVQKMLPPILEVSLNVLHWTIDTNGQTATVDALRKGLIRAVCAACEADRINMGDYLTYLHRAVGSHLCYRRVVSAAFADIARVHDSNTYGWLSSKDSPAWLSFRLLVEQRQEYTRRFVEDILRRCYVCKRSASELASPLRQCTGCDGVRYCSRDCQKGDWYRHKYECMCRREAKTFRGLDAYDREFIRWLAVATLTEQSPALQNILRADYLDIPLEDLVFNIDLRDSEDTAVSVRYADSDEGWQDIISGVTVQPPPSHEAEVRVQTITSVWIGRSQTAQLRSILPCPGIQHCRRMQLQ